VQTRRHGWLLVVAMLCAAIVAPLALAAPPVIERESVDETFQDDFLTAACGVPVHIRAVGHQMTRTSTGGNGKLIETYTINIVFTATSNYGQFRFRDVGADVTRITKNGVVVQLIGKLPFWFNGTAWIDPGDPGDPLDDVIIKGPTGSDLFASMIDDACSALAP
jgi:hypothetical protein